MTPDQLKRLGVYDASEAADDAYARVLLLGPAKLGKTSCLAMTAPNPLIINCDGISATKGAKRVIDDHPELELPDPPFRAIDAYSRNTWRDACRAAVQMAEAGMCRTIVVDTITLMQDALIDDLMVQGLTGFDLWREVQSETLKGIKLLKMAPAHLFVVAHMVPGTKDETEGILPLVAGQSAQKIPAMLHDTVLFVYDEQRPGAEPSPHRFFALGPQGTWRYGGRHIKQSCQIPADCAELFDKLGIKP